MVLKLPTPVAGDDREPDLELNAEEMAGVAKFLDMAIRDVETQGKQLVDRFNGQTVVHKRSMTKKQFTSELQGMSVILNYLKGMKVTVQAMIDAQSVEDNALSAERDDQTVLN